MASMMSNHKTGHVMLVVYAFIVCLALWYQQHDAATQDPHRCRALANTGSWSKMIRSAPDFDKADWRPAGCMMHKHSSQSIQQCVQCGTVLFMGDSTIRQTFWATARKLNSTKANALRKTAPKHEGITFNHNCVKIEFVWDPYLNISATTHTHIGDFYNMSKQALVTTEDSPPRALLAGVGLWHARYLEEEYHSHFVTSAKRLDGCFESNNASHGALDVAEIANRGPLIAIAPVLNPYRPNLSEDRASTLTPSRISELNRVLRDAQRRCGWNVFWSFLEMTKGLEYAYEATGIHVVDRVADARADVFLNYLCNRHLPQKYPFDTTCCVAPPEVRWIQRCILSLGLSSPLLVFLIPLAKDKVLPTLKDLLYLSSQQAAPAAVILLLALTYCFIADRTIYFDKIVKEGSVPKFLIFTAVSFVLGVFSAVTSQQPASEKASLHSTHANPILSRQQTEEWKGWMQIVIVFYHYFGMSKVLWVYQFIRLTVASYLFMTGFGHTVYFMKTNNFALRRMASILIRLNLLSFLLAYTMATDYDFYYFPALCSFWVVVVYLTLYGINSRVLRAGLMPRILLSIGNVSLVVRYPGIVEGIFALLHRVCRMNLNAREFRFRVTLDMYVVYVGMLVAGAYVQFSGLPKSYWEDNYPSLRQWRSTLERLLVITCLTAFAAYFWYCLQFADKFASNKWHPYTSPLVILAFIGIRNVTPELRAHHSQMFAWFGRCSLETFILQYHVWLAADTKGILHLPVFGRLRHAPYGFPESAVYWLQFAIITVYFLWTSWAVSRATNTLTAWFIGQAGLKSELKMADTDAEAASAVSCGPRSFGDRLRGRLALNLRDRLLLLLAVLCLLNWLW